MKNINEMTDNELRDLQYEAKEILNRRYAERVVAVTVNSMVATVEERERALNVLHEIRLEMWRRGYVVPTADRRDDYMRHLDKHTERYETAKASGDVVKMFDIRQSIEDLQDKLDWIK